MVTLDELQRFTARVGEFVDGAAISEGHYKYKMY